MQKKTKKNKTKRNLPFIQDIPAKIFLKENKLKMKGTKYKTK